MSALFFSLAGGGLAVCLALGMAFSLMETVILRLNRLRLVQLLAAEHAAPTTEQEIFRETKEVYHVTRLGLCATLIVAGFCLQAILGRAATLWGLADVWGNGAANCAIFALVLLVLPPVYLFFVYAVPRLLVRQESIENEGDLPFWMRPFLALVRFLTVYVRYFLPPSRFFLHHRLTKSDIMTLVTDLEGEEETSENGAREDSGPEKTREEEETDEEEFIYNILDLQETLVREVMKPINIVVAVRLGTTTVEGLRDLARRTGYSRFPVYRDRIVDLVGYVSIYDVLISGDPARSLESFVTPAYVVPEFMRVDDLLQEFRERGEEAAVVVDEYGGCSGWVTREDALEEIVGEIEDEFVRRARLIRKLDDRTWLADGAADVDDLAEEMPIEFEEGQYDTLAGFILMRLGRLPAVGDALETEKAVFTVERMEGYRIAEVRIVPREQKNDSEALPPAS